MNLVKLDDLGINDTPELRVRKLDSIFKKIMFLFGTQQKQLDEHQHYKMIRESDRSVFIGKAENATEITANGLLIFHNEGKTIIDINVPTSNMQTGATAPTIGALFGSNIRGYLFAGGTSGISDELHASGEEINHYYAEGTNAELHLHFYNSTLIGTSNKGVTWYYEGVWTNNLAVASVVSGTVQFTYPDNTPAWTLNRLKLVDLNGTGKKYGSQLSLMFRRVRDANNTYADDIHPSSFGVHIEIDQMGSNTIANK